MRADFWNNPSRKTYVFRALGLGFVMMAGQAQACACCAEPGTRFVDEIVMTQAHVGQIATRETAGNARLFLTACGLDCVEGVVDPQDSYAVHMAVSEAGVEFDLSDGAGLYRGTIGFDWPATLSEFAVDTALSEGPVVDLYREVQLRGEVYGTDDFAGLSGAPAELIYAGHGNMCFGLEAVTRWRLSVSGEAAEVTFFGALARGR